MTTEIAVEDRESAPRLDMGVTEPDWALGYRFDVVLKGREQTPFEEDHDDD